MKFYALQVKDGFADATWTGTNGEQFYCVPLTGGVRGFLPIKDAYSRGCCDAQLHDWAPVYDAEEANAALTRYLTHYPNAAGKVDLVQLPYLSAPRGEVEVVCA